MRGRLGRVDISAKCPRRHCEEQFTGTKQSIESLSWTHLRIKRAMTKRKCRQTLVKLLCSVLLLSGCASNSGPPGLSLKNISLVSDPHSNLNSGLTVDFIAVYDKNLLTKLQGMTAVQYFSSIDQLRRDNLSLFDVWRWELVPHQLLENYKPVFEKNKAWGGLVFANYHTPGDHRVSVGNAAYIRIVLGEKDIEAVAPEEAPEEPEAVETITIYPVKETVLLNTQTSNTGMTQKNYESLKKGGQTRSTQPQAAVSS